MYNILSVLLKSQLSVSYFYSWLKFHRPNNHTHDWLTDATCKLTTLQWSIKRKAIIFNTTIKALNCFSRYCNFHLGILQPVLDIEVKTLWWEGAWIIILVTEVMHRKWTLTARNLLDLYAPINFAYSLKVKGLAWNCVQIVASAMTSLQLALNVSRKTRLISRFGFFLRVTDDTVEGSRQGVSDVYSKFNSSVSYKHTINQQVLLTTTVIVRNKFANERLDHKPG